MKKGIHGMSKVTKHFAETVNSYKPITIVMHCANWYHSHNLKNVKNTHGGVLLLVKVTLLLACNFIKSNTLPWVFFSLFKNCTNCTKSHKTSLQNGSSQMSDKALQKHSLRGVLLKKCSQKLPKIHRKTPPVTALGLNIPQSWIAQVEALMPRFQISRLIFSKFKRINYFFSTYGFLTFSGGREVD